MGLASLQPQCGLGKAVVVVGFKVKNSKLKFEIHAVCKLDLHVQLAPACVESERETQKQPYPAPRRPSLQKQTCHCRKNKQFPKPEWKKELSDIPGR
ncbi:hypothetical protein EYF80_019552 [Liparis tanakae]|uniref:Uncharacterized protein n=1 Tax=Liparis tanakae TaxID=230148 RepID=A0A4Z2HX88_9TELE|nr:hypothetical protein EYF80_019552 [Liparis tanakae]